jgi:thiaminase/transcriptional activator TenA
MKLSTIVWKKSSNIIEAIKSHSFNQELIKGILPLDKFSYYLEQDAYYLEDFTRCLALIASKISAAYMKYFLHFALDVLHNEQQNMNNLFRKLYKFEFTGNFTHTTLSYTSFIGYMCSSSSIEVAVASILPCFWIYREVGVFAAGKHTINNNPYLPWIETYSSAEFNIIVDKIIDIFDVLAKETTIKIKTQMSDTFYKSACLEWHFWNDCYNKNVFDDIDGGHIAL